ncbi:hypothetical protein V6N13_074197 [Hibiscus sabdariffa]|uniref:DUF4283 domain-containing protein n=1 Tax=Hibiscus sabdariffa TaxID=183260 RepID=A0ABR2U7Y6_9ROSI
MSLKPSYYRVKFPTEEIQNDILARGPWTFKGDWLALAALNPAYSMDFYTFLSMNVWIRIYGIPSVLMDDDDIANHTGNSLGIMVRKVVKVDTRRIDFNMVDYLCIGIILDVTKPVRRCVAIGGSGPSPKLCPLQYERLPTLCHGYGIIGHALNACPTFKPSPNSKLQYGDWLRYIPPKKQEPHNRSKGSIRYMDGINSPNIKPAATVPVSSSTEALNMVDDAETTKGFVIPVDATTLDPLGDNSDMSTMIAAATKPTVHINSVKYAQMATATELTSDASDPIIVPTSLADVNTKVPMGAILDSPTTEPFGSTLVPPPTNQERPEGFIDFLSNPNVTSTEVPYLLDNVGLDVALTNLLPLPQEEGLDYDLGKSFLATSTMLVMFDAWFSNTSPSHTATIDEETPLTISRGAKRRLSMQHDIKTKRPRPPPTISKTRAGMSSVKNSSAEVDSQPSRGK